MSATLKPTDDDKWLDYQLANRRGVIELEPRTYKFQRPHNVRKGATKIDGIVGSGKSTVLEFKGGKQGPLFDATGNAHLIWERFTIDGDRSDPPDAGLLFARAESRNSTGLHRLDAVHCRGAYLATPAAFIGSEMNVADQCLFSNYHPNGRGWFIGAFPDVQINTPFGPFTGGSCIDNQFRMCHFGSYGFVGEKECPIVIGAGAGVVIFDGGSVSVKPPAGETNRKPWGSAAIDIYEDARGNTHDIIIDNLQCETMGADRGMVVRGNVSGITVRNSHIYGQREAIAMIGDIQGVNVEKTRLYGGFAKYDWDSAEGVRSSVALLSGRLRRSNLFSDAMSNSWLPNRAPDGIDTERLYVAPGATVDYRSVDAPIPEPADNPSDSYPDIASTIE